jgi:hypothetical protein
MLNGRVLYNDCALQLQQRMALCRTVARSTGSTEDNRSTASLRFPRHRASAHAEVGSLQPRFNAASSHPHSTVASVNSQELSPLDEQVHGRSRRL